MKPPHEQKWIAKPETDADDPMWMVVGPDRIVMSDTVEEPAARLIAQAPAMARALIALMRIVEESEHHEDDEATVGQVMLDAQNTLLAAGVRS